jgi:hypothetical protein
MKWHLTAKTPIYFPICGVSSIYGEENAVKNLIIDLAYSPIISLSVFTCGAENDVQCFGETDDAVWLFPPI